MYKIKKRIDETGNGLLIRPYCGTIFNTSTVCEGPIYNETVKRYTVNSLLKKLF